MPATTGLPNLDVRSLAFGLDGIAAGTDAGVALSPNGSLWHDGGLDRYSISAVAVAANYPQFTVIAGADAASSGTLASGYLFSSTGGGAWQVLQSGLPSGALVSSITAGQIDAAVPKRPLVVATSQGIFRSGDGGATWTAGTGAPQGLTFTNAQFGPLDPTLAYAGADAGGSSGGDLYRSTDGGLTYHKADTGLPKGSKNVKAIAIANTKPPEVIVALNPPTGGSHVYLESDSTAPAPPTLIAKSPGRRCLLRCRRGSPRPHPRPRRSSRPPLHPRVPSSALRRLPSTGRPRSSTRCSSCYWRCTCTSAGVSATTSKDLPEPRRPTLRRVIGVAAGPSIPLAFLAGLVSFLSPACSR